MAKLLEEFCGSTFWDNEIVWNTTNPDLPECFQKTVLIWFPCVVLWLTAPFLVINLRHSSVQRIPWSGLIISKLVIGVLTSLLIFMDAIRKVNLYLNNFDVASVDFISPLIHYTTLILATALMYAEKKRGTPPSGVIFFFWLLLSLTGVVTYRTHINMALDQNNAADQDLVSFVIYMVYYPLVVAELVLSCFSNSSPALKVFGKGKKEISPEVHASYLSRILFAWFDRMVITGYRRPLQYDDVWQLREDLKTKTIAFRFQRQWKAQLAKEGVIYDCGYNGDDLVEIKTVRRSNKKPKPKPSLFIALCKTFGPEFLFTTFLELISIGFAFVNPIFLELLIKFVQSDEPPWRGYLYGFVLLVSALLHSLIVTNLIHVAYSLSAKVRSALIHVIYTKAMRLSNSARRTATVGEIVNLMAVDSQSFLDLIPDLNTIWSAPLVIGVALYMLWGQLGLSVLTGVAVLLVLVPLNSFLMKKMEKIQEKQMKQKDQRVKLMNELLNGIKVLKMYAWEIPFASHINNVRLKELSLLKISAYYTGASSFVFRSMPFFMLLGAFGTYVTVDSSNILDASKAFVSLSLFNIVRLPLVIMPNVIIAIAKARVSLNRMLKFFLSEELDLSSVTRDCSKGSCNSVCIEDGTFSWNLEMEPNLKNVNLIVPKGNLVAIVGTVGAGKSSLLSAILGDMEKLHGIVKMQGSIAYTSQQAWIQNATVRDNITFGSHYDENKYNNIIKACDLVHDLTILPAGSDTEVGEKGINLSGGQKQRISLARAVYNDAEVYLLDDPLSAVDTHVGKHIFDQVIGSNGLLKKKTRILVTHGISYLPQVDKIVVLKNQTISEVGSYQELLDRKGAFAEFLLTYLNDVDESEDVEVLEEIKESLLMKLDPESDGHRSLSTSEVSESLETVRKVNRTLSSHASRESGGQPEKRASPDVTKDNLKKQDGKLVTTETSETGTVDLRIYLYYLSCLGLWIGIGTVILNIVAWISNIGSSLWLEAWSSDPPPINGTQDIALRDLRLGVYGGLGFSSGILICGATTALILNCIRASNGLHDQMLTTVLHSPMAFFDTTPVGRILNRFSQDLNVVDSSLPIRARFSISTTMLVINSLVVIALETPIFLAVIIPIGAVYYVIQRFYLMTSRQLKRMESVTRSAIYSHFSETLAGCPTIRAYGKQEEFIVESNSRVDESQCYFYAGLVCSRWLKIRVDFVGNMIIASAIGFALLNKDNMNSSAVGLSITTALSITSLLNWAVRMLSDLEKDFVAVERIKEYIETDHEASWEIKDNKPPLNWPNQGCITFDKYKTRYREGLDMVLHGITCNIQSQEKVGVVGRTGAGKSSLTLALFRIIEAAEGAIFIDGINIANIGLHDLRSQLTIIPQDPVLFSGTLRSNLDPFDAYSDEQLWAALQHCHLHAFVKSLPATLFYEIAEGGENLSVGQRQLVCLGRALLRKTKVLILDEATAAVDLETDDLIQATIRKEFANCTIITIAHRLNTILDNDRIMVIDAGIIKEFDKPSVLLQNTNSVFYSMTKDAGLVTDQSTAN